MTCLVRYGFGLAFTLATFAAACGNNSGGSGSNSENTGSSCSSAAQCYPGMSQTSLQGTVTCLTQVTGGYCTHTCQSDANCCAVPGECQTNLPQVCGPFESTGQTYCFLSCEASVISAAGYTDETAFCQHFADASFTCRSTGGGSANKKICAP